MSNMSFMSRLKTIFNLVISQSFFITLFVILVLTIALLVVNLKVKSKAPKYAIGVVYVGLAILILGRYGSYLGSLNDSIVDKFFRGIYFPNIVVYFAMLIISILLISYIMVDGRFSLFSRIYSFCSFFLTWFFFVLVIDTVKSEQLSFYEIKDVYGNQTIAVLMQATMWIFLVWCFAVVIELIVRKLSHKMDNKKPSDKVVNKPVSKKSFNLLKKKKDDDEVVDYNPNDNT